MTKDAATRLEDAFGAARSYLHAIRLAAKALPRSRDMCAFDLLAEQAEHEINQAQEATDTLLSAPVDKSNNGEKSP
jgi:hypothetical protein